eukprot:Skav203598  [mRNA]  locus=scaffold935:261424:266022:+ [translate_table: standard]
MTCMWEDTLWRYDFYGSPQCLPAFDRNNLLCSALEMTDSGLVKADLLCPAGQSTAATIKDVMILSADEKVDTVWLQWDSPEQIPSKCFLLHAKDNFFGSTDFLVDQDTVVVPLHEREEHPLMPLRVFEMFAGGIGGWHAALTILQRASPLHTQVIAIENDLEIAQAYSVTHDSHIIDGFHSIPTQYFRTHSADFVIHGDITQSQWLPAVAEWGPECCAISSPCPPWSGASNGVGLNSAQGMLFPEAIVKLKLLRPAFAVIEQVGAFATHPHQPLIVRMLRWAGYRLRWAKTLDLHHACPVNRPRWLGIATRIMNDRMDFDRMHLWITQPQQTPRSFDAFLKPHAVTSDLLIPDTAFQMASNPMLLPPAKRKGATRENTLEKRCSTPDQVVPCFMASYTRQHEIRRDLLESKGLMVHFAWDPMNQCAPRMWSPVEALALHAMCDAAFVPNDTDRAWLIIGNHIAVPHALLLWVNSLRMYSSKKIEVTMEHAMSTMDKFRFKLTKADKQELPGGTFHHMPHFGLPFDADKFREFASQTSDGNMPKQTRWHHEVGFHTVLDETTSAHEPAEPSLPENPEVSQLSQPSCASTEIQISDTQQFIPTACGQIVVGDLQQVFWFASDVPLNALLAVWGGFYCVDPDRSPDPDFSLRLVPDPAYHRDPEETFDGSVLVLYHEGNLTIYDDSEVSNQAASMDGVFQLTDQFGPIPDFKKIETMVATTEVIPPTDKQRMPFPHFIFSADSHVAAFTTTNEKGELQMIFTGPVVERDTCLQFWANLLSPEALSMLRLTLQTQSTSSAHFLTFEHTSGPCAYPRPALCILLFLRAFQFLMDHMANPHGTRKIRVRWLSRQLWNGTVDDHLSAQVIITCAYIAARTLCAPPESLQRIFRIIHKGKMVMNETVLSEVDNAENPMTLNMIRGMTGGGPQKTTTKQANVTQVKNSLAATLLQEGYELEWISKTLDVLVQHGGVKPLLPCTNMPQGSAKLQQIHQLIRQAGITIPELKSHLSAAHANHQKSKRRIQQAPDPKQYMVQDGCLLFADGEPANQMREFSTHQRGFFLATIEEAQPWIVEGAAVAPDELALLVFGNPGLTTTLPSQTVTLPCWDSQQRSVLVAFTMYQLGEKKIQAKTWENQKVPQDTAALVALTVWRSDWESQWTSLCDNPYAVLRNHLNMGDSLVAMWGKSYRDGRRAVSPISATTMQVHCSVKEESLTRLLRDSGYNMVWATPKTPEGKPCQRWKLLWLPQDVDINAARLTAAKLSQVCGLARSGDKLAIRVQATGFEASWRVLHPDVEIPKHIETDHLYRLDSLPFGTTATMLTAWGEHQGWPLKPIKAIGPKGWLVGSPAHPKCEQMAFNGAPILTRYVKPRSEDRQNPIIAGPRLMVNKSAHHEPSQPSKLAPLQGDPWAPFFHNRAVHSSSVAAPAASTGPTDQRFQQHEERFSRLEETMAQLQMNVESSRNDLTGLQSTIQANDLAMKQHVDQQIGALRTEIDTSFSKALKEQSSHFDQNMHELKQLMASVAKRKQPAATEDEEM